MMGKARKLETELRRLFVPNTAALFLLLALTGVGGLALLEPVPAIGGILGASIVAHLVRKADYRWRDTTDGESV